MLSAKAHNQIMKRKTVLTGKEDKRLGTQSGDWQCRQLGERMLIRQYGNQSFVDQAAMINILCRSSMKRMNPIWMVPSCNACHCWAEVISSRFSCI